VLHITDLDQRIISSHGVDLVVAVVLVIVLVTSGYCSLKQHCLWLWEFTD